MTAHQHHSSGSSLLPVLAGAVLGAAGVAWWLLSEAERRRLEPRQQRALRLSRLQEGADIDGPDDDDALAAPRQRELHDKVHELNQAIDDVRRQLESMGSR